MRGIGMQGALVTLVAENAQRSSDRPATCTSARAVATVECTSSEQSPVRDTMAPFVTGNLDGMLKPRSRSPWSSPMRGGSQSRTRVNRGHQRGEPSKPVERPDIARHQQRSRIRNREAPDARQYHARHRDHELFDAWASDHWSGCLH